MITLLNRMLSFQPKLTDDEEDEEEEEFVATDEEAEAAEKSNQRHKVATESTDTDRDDSDADRDDSDADRDNSDADRDDSDEEYVPTTSARRKKKNKSKVTLKNFTNHFTV